jgi:hypothetical protein
LRTALAQPAAPRPAVVQEPAPAAAPMAAPAAAPGPPVAMPHAPTAAAAKSLRTMLIAAIVGAIMIIGIVLLLLRRG